MPVLFSQNYQQLAHFTSTVGGGSRQAEKLSLTFKDYGHTHQIPRFIRARGQDWLSEFAVLPPYSLRTFLIRWESCGTGSVTSMDSISVREGLTASFRNPGADWSVLEGLSLPAPESLDTIGHIIISKAARIARGTLRKPRLILVDAVNAGHKINIASHKCNHPNAKVRPVSFDALPLRMPSGSPSSPGVKSC